MPDPRTTVDPTKETPRASADSPVQPVFRPNDDRPIHDVAALERAGIRRFESPRLILYTDIPAEQAARLPPLVDALYDELVNYFGELPPARDGSAFQITGFLMADTERFRSQELLPDDLPPFEHGRHRGQRFWMREQDYDYYRRHLLLHEATHCFMTRLPGSVGPDWYMEGMAELFGTHAVSDDGVRFGVMPASPEASAGSGRIALVRGSIAQGDFKTLDDVLALKARDFAENDAYAWSWAACYFLDKHSRYRDRFRELKDPALRRRLDAEFHERFDSDADTLEIDWALFAQTLRYGYELDAAETLHRRGKPLTEPEAAADVAARAGWQSSGVAVEAGRSYRITADGRFTLAEQPRPWVSDAGGISFDYFDGRPIGRLLAAVLVDDRSDAPDPAGGLLSPIDVGRETTIEPLAAGTLYFRINDRWDRLGDNRGSVRVTIRPARGPSPEPLPPSLPETPPLR